MADRKQRPVLRARGKEAGPPPFKTQAALAKMLRDFAVAGVHARGRDQHLMQAAISMSARAQQQRDALEQQIRAGGIGQNVQAENAYLKICEELRLLDAAIANGHRALGPVDKPLDRPGLAAPVNEAPGPEE
jgi:hypothetical protein